MARVQKTNQASQKTNQTAKKTSTKVNPKSRQELAKTNAKAEPSKNEIMFFRIGIIIIGLTVIIGAVIVLIQYFMSTTEEELPFDDYIHITDENLAVFTKEDEFGNYGDREYYKDVEGYEDINDKIVANDILYVYFYRGSDIQQDVVDAILALENLDELTFVFINMDLNPNLFENTSLAFLNLNSDADHMLLTFDYYPEDAEERFSVWSDSRNILIDINKL
ncbi:MAG: hypothetical protein RBT45_06535 [Acholeplasmataceae bacterium]|jgi:hypothetical protein|nr:hypothetical protein [Acholeplasmataceae bacterium]